VDADLTKPCVTSRSDSAASSGCTTNCRTSISPHHRSGFSSLIDHRSGFSSLQGSTQELDNIRAPPSKLTLSKLTQELDNIRAPPSKLTLSKLSTRTRERADESNKDMTQNARILCHDDTKCARCSSQLFINLKLPCGRVVFLCPTCTADFRVHLGQKISEVLLRPFCAPHMQASQERARAH
jgi:hypothetical protein